MKKFITFLLTNLLFVFSFAQNLDIADAARNSDSINISKKIYINSDQIKFFDNQIFVLIDDNLESVDRIESDAEGLYLIEEIQTGGFPISLEWKCRRCGYPNSPFSNYCKNCGKRYNDPN